jgi:hypothetical protein
MNSYVCILHDSWGADKAKKQPGNSEPKNIRTIEPKNDEVQSPANRSSLLPSAVRHSNVLRFAFSQKNKGDAQVEGDLGIAHLAAAHDAGGGRPTS